MRIRITIKSVYGKELIYPVCDQAREFAKLTRTKTLTLSNIETIKRLGFTVSVPILDWPSLSPLIIEIVK